MKRSVVRALPKQPISFIPNENVYRFESELMTPEQNRAAIPARPRFDHLPKRITYMVSPDDTRDLVTRPSFTDVVAASTALKGLLFRNHRFVTDSGDALAELLFGSIVSKWVDVFNKQVVPLKDVHANTSIPLSESRKAQVAAFLESSDLTNLIDRLDHYHKNTTAAQAPLGIDHVATYLLHDPAYQDTQRFDSLMEFSVEHIDRFSHETIGDFISAVAETISTGSISQTTIKARSFRRMVVTAEEIFSDAVAGADAPLLNKLVELLTLSDIDHAATYLCRMVTKHRAAPLPDTLDLFLTAYMKENRLREDTLRQLHALKPVFFHRELTSTAMQFLLTTVGNVVELHHLVRLASPEMRGRFATELKDALARVQPTDQSPFEKELQQKQLQRALNSH